MRSFYLKAVIFIVVFKLIDLSLFSEFRRLDSRGPADEGSLNLLYNGQLKEDIICFGDSRIRYHVHPKVVQDVTGLSTYNFGLSATNFDQQLFTMREYLDNNRSPRIVVFEADSRQLDPAYLHFDTKLFRPYMNYSSRVAGLFSSSPLEGITNELVRCRAFKGRLIPLLRRALGNSEEQDAPTVFKGASLVLDGRHPSGLHASRDVRASSEGRRADYRGLAQFANSEKILLVLLTPPEYKHDVQLDPTQADLAYGFFSQLANSSHWVYYLNYARDSQLTNTDELWWDAEHLNLKGMTKFSASLGEALKRIKSGDSPKVSTF